MAGPYCLTQGPCSGQHWHVGMPGNVRSLGRAVQGSNAACTVTGLRAGCTYRVRTCAANAAGPGAYSMPADVVTAADKPDAPDPPSMSTRGQDCLALCWVPPAHNGGAAITSYRLEMSRGASLAGQGTRCACDAECP